MSDLLDLAGKVVEIARAKGADAARAGAHRTREVEVTWRDGKIENVSEATTRGVWVDLFVDGRFSEVSTSDLRTDALARFVADSVAMARALEKDPFRGLPDRKLYDGRSTADLQVRDPSHEEVTPEQRRLEAQSLEAAARAVEGGSAIVSVTSHVSDKLVESGRAASDGFQGACARTTFNKSVSIACKDADGRRPEDGSWGSARFRADLPSTAQVARDAVLRATGRLGAKKIETSKLTMIVEPRAARRLTTSLLGPMSGGALQQKQSYLDGQLGKRVGSTHFTLVDDPLLPKGLESFPYDSDGFAGKKRTMVEGGILRAYYIDDYYGRKLKTAPTTGEPTNLVFGLGTRGLEALQAEAKEAILVTSFLGGNSNGTTGDYSFGVAGYRIRGGKRAEPVTEMNVAGNQRELWMHLAAVGNDPYVYSGVRAPTLVFEGVTFAGA
ncbi:MAG TPA: TldD/PmbA family protein [Polyangiaceae bacterium]|jgi:PmbA protein